MRLLFNALQAANRSGTGRYSAELALALMRRKDLELILAWPQGATVAVTPNTHLMPLQAHGWRRLLFDQWSIERMFYEESAHLAHYPASIGRVFGEMPFVLTIHDLCVLRHPEWFRPERVAYYRRAIAASALHAKRILADSLATADDIVALLRFPINKIDIVPLGVTSEFHPCSFETVATVRARYALPERFFLYVGTIEPRKNLARLIQAWDSVADHVPDLVLAGREGWKCFSVHNALAKAHHAPRIHLPGFIPQDDLPALLSAAEAFVWPSLYEGFGLPPLEAMACGVPVLTSDISSLPEIAADAALLVPPEDPAAIAEGLRALASNAALRATLREAGIKRAAEYTWDRTAAAAVTAYAKAIK